MAITQVKTTGLADDAVTGAKIADDTVAEANMANDAISLAELKAGTDGQIITYDASGNPTAVGPGTDGQVLTSTGAGSPPAFEDADGGGSASGTYGSATSMGTGNTADITVAGGSSTHFKILFENITADADANIWIRLGDSGGVESTGYFGYMGYNTQNSTSANLEDHAFSVNDADPNSDGHYGSIDLYNYSGNIWYADINLFAAGSSYNKWNIQGRKETSATLTTVQLRLQNSANWTGGHYRVITY